MFNCRDTFDLDCTTWYNLAMKSKTVYINYKSRIQKLMKEKMQPMLVGIGMFTIAFSLFGLVIVKNNYFALTAVGKSENVKKAGTPKEKGDITPKAAVTGQVKDGIEYYTVLEGESLSDVSMKVYGDLNKWSIIQQANNIYNPDIVPAGTVLVIPR